MTLHRKQKGTREFFVLGVDHRTAPLDVRVQAAFSADPFQVPWLRVLEEKVFLSTCNRVELYGVSDSPSEILEHWMQESALKSEFKTSFYLKTGEEALRHLFRVASSLESMVLGENQIFGQVKKSYELACERGVVGSQLHRIFQAAFRTAKRVRTETEVGLFPVSVPSIGVKMAEKILGDLRTKKAAVLGLGEIGQVAAEHFGSVGPEKLYLWNRTTTTAQELCEKFVKESIRAEVLTNFQDAFRKADVLVFAAKDFALGADDIKILEARSKPFFILDLGVPPLIRNLSNASVVLYRVDDLSKIAEENNTLRGLQAEKAQDVVSDEVEKTLRTLSGLSAQKTFQLLEEKFTKIRQEELSALRKKVGDFSAQQWSEIEHMSERLQRKILQDPLGELKSRLVSEEKETWLEFFRNLFRI